jgi:tol-pal system protein YbgF
MKLRLNNIVVFVGLALSVPTAIYALAPVEDASTDTQGVQSGQLVPATTTDGVQPTSTNGAPVNQNAEASTQKQQQDSVTDNNPLIGSSNMSNDASPTIQSPAISGADNSAMSSLPLSARVARLEQQMQNLVHANTAAQVSSLQQQIQQLSGELQVQQHDIKLLNQQMRNFYQDLSTQIKQLKNMSGSSDDSSNSPPPRNINSQLPSASDVGQAATQKKKLKTSLNNPINEFSVVASNKYKAALNSLMSKKYSIAEQGFKDYINDYPNGHFVVSAHYWLGEIYVQQRNLSSATKQFNIVVTQFPHSNKVADAKVKIGIIHASQGQVARARVEFRKVKQKYPGTTAAQLAAIQLQQLGRT